MNVSPSSNTNGAQANKTYMAANTVPLSSYANEPMDGNAVATDDIWYVFEAGRSKCVSEVRINSRDIYNTINMNPMAAASVMTVERGMGPNPSAASYIWNPSYNILMPIANVRTLTVPPTAILSYIFDGLLETRTQTYQQKVWYRWYDPTLVLPGEYLIHQIPDGLSGFKLPHNTIRFEEIPEFKNGDEAYAWAESQSD